MKLEYQTRTNLNGIPSASGIEHKDGKYYVVSDNLPWLFVINEAFETVSRYPIHTEIGLEEGVLPKSVKPDFEAMTMLVEDGRTKFLMFGSGSQIPQREKLVIYELDARPDTITISLNLLYTVLREVGGISVEDFNIEAVVTTSDHLLLFNRGTNGIFVVPMHGFQKYIDQQLVPEGIQYWPMHLPEIDGLQARLSGAAWLENEKLILFTASVENTSNWIDDGMVLGSFVGAISNLETAVPDWTLRLRDDHIDLNVKVESLVAIGTEEAGVYELKMVTDNDGGESEIISYLIHLP